MNEVWRPLTIRIREIARTMKIRTTHISSLSPILFLHSLTYKQ